MPIKNGTKQSSLLGGKIDLCLKLPSRFAPPRGKIDCQGRRSGRSLKTAVISGCKVYNARVPLQLVMLVVFMCLMWDNFETLHRSSPYKTLKKIALCSGDSAFSVT